MAMKSHLLPEFLVQRDYERCDNCKVCIKQCPFEVHYYDEEKGKVCSREECCVGCQRCVVYCPKNALKVIPYPGHYRPNDYWHESYIRDIKKQAESGGIILTSCGSARRAKIYWDHILLNASQVTNPSIDPLREPMELRTFLGRKPDALEIEIGENGEDVEIKTELYPNLMIEAPILFAGMSYGAISYNAFKSLVSMLIYALKEATNYEKPVCVKIAAVHNVAAIASGMVRAGADIIAIDGFRGGTGATPKIMREHVGIPVELALAAVDQRLREEGIRNKCSVIVGGGIRCAADVVKAIALGADAVYIGTAALIALGCTMCQRCHTGKCAWGICTQDPELSKRLNPKIGAERAYNLLRAWSLEIKDVLGGMGINAIESLRGNRDHLRGIGLEKWELKVLGIKGAGE